MNCPYERCKLDFGDYSAKFPVGEDWITLNVAVERKMDFGELAQCFCKGRARFAREFDRAKEKNAKIYLLIENCSWADASWKWGGAYPACHRNDVGLFRTL